MISRSHRGERTRRKQIQRDNESFQMRCRLIRTWITHLGDSKGLLSGRLNNAGLDILPFVRITPVSEAVESCFLLLFFLFFVSSQQGGGGVVFVWDDCFQGPLSISHTDCRDSAVVPSGVCTKGDENKFRVIEHFKKRCR